MAGVVAMSTLKVYALGGLDKKSNDLNRPIEKASEMINIEYDTQSTLKKRNGYTQQVIDGIATASFDDTIYYNSKDEILGFKNGSSFVKVLKRSGNDFTTRTLAFPSNIIQEFVGSIAPIDSLTSTLTVTSFSNNYSNIFTPTIEDNSSILSPSKISIGNEIVGAGIIPGTYVLSVTSYNFKTASFIISNSQTVASETMQAKFAFNNVSISSCENQNNLYFTNTDYLSYVMKYDGSNIYRSGLPTPRLGDISGLDKYPTLPFDTTGYTRIFYSLKDINGNISYSPYVEYDYAAHGAGFIFNSLASDTKCRENGFFNKFCYIKSLPCSFTATISGGGGDYIPYSLNVSAISYGAIPAGATIVNNIGQVISKTKEAIISGASGSITTPTIAITNPAYASFAPITKTNRTIIVTRHNYEQGEKFLFDMENKYISIYPQGKSFVALEIESTTSISITFTEASIGDTEISLLPAKPSSYPNEYPLDVRTKMYMCYSSSESAGYTVLNIFVVDNGSITNNRSVQDVESVLYDFYSQIKSTKMSDIYDNAYLKTMPPICKYIASFGEQIIYASIRSYFTIYTKDISIGPNQRIDFANTSLITYSDTSFGDGPEGNSEGNFTKIGETWDGEITGIRRCNDSMVIFKNRGVFSIDGTLIDGQFTIRKITTNFAGCTSHKSILESDEGLYFQAHNGIYYTNAIGAKKLTFELDSVFLSKDYASTRSVRLKKKQKSIFYVPDIAVGTATIIVIDYYYDQVYTWKFAHTCGMGLIEDKNGDVYFCDGSKMYKFATSPLIPINPDPSYSDNGTAISAQYSTTWHHAGEPALNKKWLSIRTWGLTSDAFTATITTEGDWQAGTLLTTNQSVYGATTQTDFKMLDMQTKKALRINFLNSENNKNMVLTGYELTFEVFNNVDKN
jgi:hypothetical protein